MMKHFAIALSIWAATRLGIRKTIQEHNMRQLAALLALAAIAGGLACAREMAGTYAWMGVHEVGADGTFEYMLAYGAADYSAQGNTVMLNSAPVSGPPFRLKNETLTKMPGIRVWVEGANGLKATGSGLELRFWDASKPMQYQKQ